MPDVRQKYDSSRQKLDNGFQLCSTDNVDATEATDAADAADAELWNGIEMTLVRLVMHGLLFCENVSSAGVIPGRAVS